MDDSTSCQPASRLIEKLKSLDVSYQLDFTHINKAIYWAKTYHDGQFRKSGEPFYTHPLEVAYMVSDYQLKTDVIVTAILHDIVEDTEVTVRMIGDDFGERIAEMVDRLTRDRPDGSKLSVEQILNNAYAKQDTEVLLIKTIDRLHNMQTIQFKSPESKKRTTLETWKNFLVASASINIDLEREFNFYIYKVIPLPEGINSVEELYMLSELKERDVLSPLIFENDGEQI